MERFDKKVLKTVRRGEDNLLEEVKRKKELRQWSDE